MRKRTEGATYNSRSRYGTAAGPWGNIASSLGMMLLWLICKGRHSVDGTLGDAVGRLLPDTPRDRTGVMNANKFITGGCYVEVRLFFVYKKCIRYPYVLNEL